MLEEDGSSKYLAGDKQLFALVKDFDTQTLSLLRQLL